MTQVILTFDASSAITVALYNAAGTLVTPAPTISESPANSGRYVFTFPAVTAGTYTAIYSSGGFIVGSDTIAWDGSAIVDTAGAVIAALGTAPAVTVVSPIAADGSISIIRGNDYRSADARAFTFTFSGIPSLIGATVSLAFFDSLSGAVTTFSGTVASSTSITIELTAAQTSALAAGDPAYTYDVTATFTDAHTATLQRGLVTVTD